MKNVVLSQTEMKILKDLVDHEIEQNLNFIITLRRRIKFSREKNQELGLIPQMEESIERFNARQEELGAIKRKLI